MRQRNYKTLANEQMFLLAFAERNGALQELELLHSQCFFRSKFHFREPRLSIARCLWSLYRHSAGERLEGGDASGAESVGRGVVSDSARPVVQAFCIFPT